MRSQLVFSLWISVAGAAQDLPRSRCDFDGFSTAPRLAEVTKATVGYFGCSTSKDCLPAKLAAGDTVTLYRADGDWTCGYLHQSDGAGPGWVRSADIRELQPDPAPPVSAWVGAWVNGAGRIEIATAKPPGKLHLLGKAEWRGTSSVHTGSFEDEAAPSGNHLQVDVDPCTVDLTLIGNYLVANDNGECGGDERAILGRVETRPAVVRLRPSRRFAASRVADRFRRELGTTHSDRSSRPPRAQMRH
ncbi:MAG: hypothetical protein WDO73_16115 [Ignavibacteriota bacterium]